MKTRSCAIGLGLCLAAVAVGQDATPPQPLVELQIDGPARLAAGFQPTNLGTLLASETGKRLGQALQSFVESSLGKELPARLLHLDGRALVRVYAEPKPVQPGERPEVRVRALLALEGLSLSSLASLAADLPALIPDALQREPIEVESAAGTLRALTDGGGEGFTLPLLRSGRLLSFAGDDLTWSVAEGLREAEALPEAELGPPQGIAARVDVQRIVALARQTDDLRPNSEESVVFRAFGVDAMQTLQVRLAPAGPHVMLEAALSLVKGERGFWEAFLPPEPRAPSLLGTLTGERIGGDGYFDPEVYAKVLLDVITEVMRSFGGDDARTEMAKQLGFDLEKDLLHHLGHELVLLAPEANPATDAELMAAPRPDEMSGLCLVVAVRERAALDEPWSKLETALRDHESAEVAAQDDVHHITLPLGPDFPLHLALGTDFAGLAVGEPGWRDLNALLRTKQGGAHGEPVKALQRVQRQAPPGYCGAARLPLSSLSGVAGEAAVEVLRDLLPYDLRPDDPESLRRQLLELHPMLEKHNLDELVLLFGASEGTARARLLW